MGGGGTEYWKQVVLLLLIMLAIQSAFAVVNYYAIVKRRDTVSSFLVGYGVVVPLGFMIPYALLEYLDLESRALKFATICIHVILCYRTVEAMHGTSCDKDAVEASLGNYVAYYSSLAYYEWDVASKPIRRRRIPKSKLLANGLKFIAYFHAASIVLAIMMSCDFQPFPSRVKLDEYNLTFDLLSPSHLANCYCLALLIYTSVNLSCLITTFAENVKGYDTKPVFEFLPLLTTRNPSDFWGRKWNLFIHRMLKHGVYLPVKKFGSTKFAILLTFLASGLFHEYLNSLVWYVHKYKHDDVTGVCRDGQYDCYFPIVMKESAFFLWNGVVVTIERCCLSNRKWYQQLISRPPLFVVSTIVVMTALPISHWITGDWAEGGYFEDYSMSLWHVRKL